MATARDTHFGIVLTPSVTNKSSRFRSARSAGMHLGSTTELGNHWIQLVSEQELT
jgi:hypothetical protein